MRVDLVPFLEEHPGGAPHREHGILTLTPAGAPSSGRRWDYAAPKMRAWCGCGWVGPSRPQRRPATSAAAGKSTGKTRGTATGTGRPSSADRAAQREGWERANRSARTAMDQDWSTHVHEALPTLRVLEVMAELRDAERALTAAVIEARQGRASWTDIATATGTKRQSAHRRWRDHDPLTSDEQPRGGRPPRPAADPATVTSAPASASATRPERGQPDPGRPLPAPGPQSATDRAHVTATLVRRLAGELARRTGGHVEASWQGTRSGDGTRGGWLLEWSAGPNRTEMRALAHTVCADDPGLASLDLSALSWWRDTRDVDDAAELLAWLDAHPDQDGYRLPHVPADVLPGWPDRVPTRTRARAETLVAAGWAAQTAGEAADELATRAAAGGPAAVAAWLDELATTQDADVIDLHPQRTVTET